MQKKSALESWLGRVGWRWPDGHERLRSGQEGLSGCPQGWGWLRGARARPCPAQLLLQIHRCWTLILVWTHCLTARNTGFSSNTYSFVETLETTKNKTLYNLLLVITIVNGAYHSSCLYVFIEIDSWFITVKNEYFVNMVTFFFFFLILFFGCTTQHVGS